MMHRAWSSIVEVPYCFSRSYVKFQGHTALKIVEFDPNWAFLDYRLVAAFKSLRFALFFSKLLYVNTHRTECDIKQLYVHFHWIGTSIVASHMDHFVYAPTQWETTLQCNVVSHWLGAFTGILPPACPYIINYPTKLETPIPSTHVIAPCSSPHNGQRQINMLHHICILDELAATKAKTLGCPSAWLNVNWYICWGNDLTHICMTLMEKALATNEIPVSIILINMASFAFKPDICRDIWQQYPSPYLSYKFYMLILIKM